MYTDRGRGVSQLFKSATALKTPGQGRLDFQALTSEPADQVSQSINRR
jgi:hypothetical protein